MMNTVRIREQMGLRLVEDRKEEKTEAEARAELLMGRLCSAAGYGRALITGGQRRGLHPGLTRGSGGLCEGAGGHRLRRGVLLLGAGI